MEITLETLGLDKDLIAERVIDRLVEKLLRHVDYEDEDGTPVTSPTAFDKALQDRVKQRIDASIDNIAARRVLPNIETYLENFCLQETNSWGEKKGEKVSFIEYLIKRAELYMVEDVNHDGKSKREDSYGSWNKSGTRVAFLINKHLQYSIETAMKQALTDANKHIVGGLEQAIKIKLGEVQNSIKVGVQVGR